MALTQYDIAFMNDADEALIKQYTNEWERAHAAGDTAAEARAHDKAEAVRARYDYSGGDWGNKYINLGSQTEKETNESLIRTAQSVDPYYTANQSSVDTPNGTYTGLVDVPPNVTRIALYGALALGGIFLLKAFTK